MASKMMCGKVQLSSAMVSALSKAEVRGFEIVDPNQSDSFYRKSVCDSCAPGPQQYQVVQLVELALTFALPRHIAAIDRGQTSLMRKKRPPCTA